jgi:hypothetical protein
LSEESELGPVVDVVPDLRLDGDVIAVPARLLLVAPQILVGEVELEARAPHAVIPRWDAPEESPRLVDVQLVRVEDAPPVPEDRLCAVPSVHGAT